MGNDRYQEIREALAMETWVENDNYTLAHILVSERHGQFDLVRLVAYLLQECASTQADDARDAARYRWLRDKCDRWDGGLVVAKVTEFSLSSWSGDDLNAAIDSALATGGET